MNKYEEQIEQKTVTAMKVLKIMGFAILGLSLVVLFGFIVMWLWNGLMPEIFGLGKISYWQGVGLLILTKILFGGFGSGSSNTSSKHSSRKGSENPQGYVGTEIRNYVRDEIIKEMEIKGKFKSNEKEVVDEYSDSEVDLKDKALDNQIAEELYDKWWELEGERLFEAYMNNKK